MAKEFGLIRGAGAPFPTPAGSGGGVGRLPDGGIDPFPSTMLFYRNTKELISIFRNRSNLPVGKQKR
jgi:hypothetical protein